MSVKLFMKNTHKIAVKIWSLYHEYSGAISSISGALKRNDSSKLSRQINPNDERRDNFYIEFLEVHSQMARLYPELEKAVWSVICRERDLFLKNGDAHRIARVNEMIKKIFDEFGDVMDKNNNKACKDEMVKETFELKTAVLEFYEHLVDAPCSEGEFQESYFN